jgi:hypothetical protein
LMPLPAMIERVPAGVTFQDASMVCYLMTCPWTKPGHCTHLRRWTGPYRQAEPGT